MTSPSAPAPVRPRGPADAALPTPLTVFMRTFLPWQIWRFIRINLGMLQIIAKSHH